jgi:hypothetical protein
MNIPLTLGSYKGRSNASNAQSLVNIMPEMDTQGGVSPFFLTRTPGCKNLLGTGYVKDGRGGYAYRGNLLVVVGNRVYQIDTGALTITQRGTIDTSTGPIMFAENPDQVMFIDDTEGYVFTKATGAVAKITDLDFPTPKAVAWKDGYGVVVAADTGKFFVSAINDFTDWDTLDFTTAEFEPDNLISCAVGSDSLLAFGEKTTQVYYNSGNATFPFDNRAGANFNVGCGATYSAASQFGFVFWLDDTGQVRMLNGYTPAVVSTPQIDYRISRLSTFADAIGHIYKQEGHVFYVITFPTDKLTLCYDIVTGQWHERTSYPGDGRYRAAWIAQDGEKVFAGDYGNGRIYLLDSETYTDDGQPIRWFFTTQAQHGDNNMIQHGMFEIKFDSGVGGDEDPQVYLQYSDDDGNTWSKERWRGIGKIAEFKRRTRWYALGQARSRIYRIGGSDAVKMNAVMARLEAQALGF